MICQERGLCGFGGAGPTEEVGLRSHQGGRCTNGSPNGSIGGRVGTG